MTVERGALRLLTLEVFENSFLELPRLIFRRFDILKSPPFDRVNTWNGVTQHSYIKWCNCAESPRPRARARNHPCGVPVGASATPWGAEASTGVGIVTRPKETASARFWGSERKAKSLAGSLAKRSRIEEGREKNIS